MLKLFASILFFSIYSTGLFATDLLCNIKRSQNSEWWDGKVSIDILDNSDYRSDLIRFVTGKNPKTAYYDNEKEEWSWSELSSTEISNNTIYHGKSDDGYLTAVFTYDEKRAVINFIFGTPDDDFEKNIDRIGINNEMIKCKKL